MCIVTVAVTSRCCISTFKHANRIDRDASLFQCTCLADSVVCHIRTIVTVCRWETIRKDNHDFVTVLIPERIRIQNTLRHIHTKVNLCCAQRREGTNRVIDISCALSCTHVLERICILRCRTGSVFILIGTNKQFGIYIVITTSEFSGSSCSMGKSHYSNTVVHIIGSTFSAISAFCFLRNT